MKNKKIDFKEISNSPYFVAAIMAVVIALIIVGIVFTVKDIDTTKDKIVDARNLYEQNLKEMAILEELKAKSEVAEDQLEMCKDILPDSLGDVYILQEELLKKCKNFGLEVSSIENTVAKNETNEVIFTISCKANFKNIYDFMNYYSNLERVHRFDSISLTKEGEDGYNAVFTLAFLSEEGIEGVAASAETTAAS